MSTSAADPQTPLPDTLSEWVAAQRWYSGKGSAPHLERIGGWAMGDDHVRIATHYLLDRGPNSITLYHVPLTERAVPLEGGAPIAVRDGRYVYDAPHDPAYAAAILDLMVSESEVGGARGHRQPGTPPMSVADSAVLRGEQSNTSIICSVSGGAPVIIKVFRTLHHGENPDVTLQSAIAAAGSRRVPTSIGYLSGEWRDGGRADGVARGHLAFAQEFLPGVQDAWRVALRAAELGEDFGVAARALGAATAEVHATLASVLPTREASHSDIDFFLRGMRARLNGATAEVPSLESYRPLIETVFEAARSARWPRLQRIHGDYHLGQVLFAPDRGWVLVDFEGEPLRAMTERSEPDVTLRDIAGMLRSFDYAAASVLLNTAQLSTVALNAGALDPLGPDGETRSDWASAARHGFLEGYIARSGYDVRENRALLDAFEIDKALYEAVYEARNRPDWIAIPVAAIRRLAERSTRRAG